MMGLLCSPCQTTVMVNTMYKSYHEQLNCIQTLPSVHLYDILGHSDVQYLLLERNSFSRILSLSKGDTCHTFLRKKEGYFISLSRLYIVIQELDEPVVFRRERNHLNLAGIVDNGLQYLKSCSCSKIITTRLIILQERENKNTSVSAVGALVNTSTDIFLHFVVCSL